MNKIKIGTRSSPLALWQTEWTASKIKDAFPDTHIEIIHVKTKGDKILDVALSKIGGKGLFTKELENELLAGNIDLAVHSLKDMPTELPQGLTLGAITERHDARDVLISKNKGETFQTLRKNAVIATGSLRRRAQLLSKRPDIETPDLRGNLQTRLKKFEDNNWDGIILAAAGVQRMNKQDYISSYFEFDEWLPAVGQGAMAVEISEENNEIKEILKAVVNHPETETVTKAERSMLKALGGGCQTPIASIAEMKQGKIFIRGLVAAADGSKVFRAELYASAGSPEETGREIAEMLLKQGAQEVLKDIL